MSDRVRKSFARQGLTTLRAGRTLTVCRGDAYAERDGERTHVATMLATMVSRRAPSGP